MLSVLVGVCCLIGAGCDSDPSGNPAVDAGSTLDSGSASDLGSVSDMGTFTDGGDIADAAHLVDAGPRTDAAEVTDAGELTDAAEQPDAAEEFDANFDGDASLACGFVATLNRVCTTDLDCAGDLHQINCCGTHAAIGMNVSEVASFSELEATCAASYPRCRCAVFPTQTDSGETLEVEGDLQVACVSRGPTNICLTYVHTRPMDGV